MTTLGAPKSVLMLLFALVADPLRVAFPVRVFTVGVEMLSNRSNVVA